MCLGVLCNSYNIVERVLYIVTASVRVTSSPMLSGGQRSALKGSMTLCVFIETHTQASHSLSTIVISSCMDFQVHAFEFC